jgi:hypothetical protein
VKNPILYYFQSLYLKLPSGNELTILTIAGRALGIPGGFIQGEDGGTGVTLQPGGDSGNTQLGSLRERSLRHEIEVALDPLIIKVGDLPDFQVDPYDLLGLTAAGKIESNFQDILGDRKFMHRISAYGEASKWLKKQR